jgi:hypothetical protein
MAHRLASHGAGQESDNAIKNGAGAGKKLTCDAQEGVDMATGNRGRCLQLFPCTCVRVLLLLLLYPVGLLHNRNLALASCVCGAPVSSSPGGVQEVADAGACCDLCIGDVECEAFV